MTKKIFIVALALLGTFEIGFSQSKLVKTATKNLSSQSLDKAVEAINEAIKDPESMYSANTWIVRGRVYMGVAANAFFARNYVNAEDSAYASFLKALELDLSDKNQILVSLEWPKLALAYYNKGADKFQEKKYNEATSAFEKSAVLSEKNGALDTSAIFNIALSAANDDQLEKAAEKYQFLVDCKYPMMGIYTGLGDVYFRLDKKKEAEQIAALLVERFGEDSIAYTSAAAINLRLGNNEKAEKILSEALAKWATTPSLYLYIGIAYENGNQENKAEAAYKKALELNPEYKEAVYNLGAFYVNKGIKIKSEADNLPLEETQKYEKGQALANEALNKAIPYLEKVIATQPDNIDAMTTLKGIYTHLRKTEEAKKMQEKIDALGATKQ